MRRAKLFGDPRQGIKNTIRQPEMSERESTPLPPRPVRWRPAPMCSDPVAANSSTARAPSIGPQRNSLNRKIDGSRRSSSADFCENEMVAAAGHALCRFAARASAPLHQGIKTAIAPAGNVEARARCRGPPARALAAGELHRSARSANHSTGKLAARAGRAAPIFAKTKWSPPRVMLAVNSPARASAPLHQGIKTTIAPAGNVEARA